MEFAKNLLRKYGWKEGEGLGKKSDGITKPLQPNLKFDTSGLGVDKAAEFNNHWWERVFNAAANNIEVNKNEKSVEIAVKNKDFVELTTKEYSVKGMRKDGYIHFVKKSVLSGLHEKSEACENTDSEDTEQMPNYKLLTDAELFAACGGRTAHKGARHGLKLSGKLSRIEQQERELLQKMQDNANLVEESEWKVAANKKKRRRKEHKVEDNSDLQSVLYTTEYHVKSKKKRKREKQLDIDLSTALSSIDIEGDIEKKDENIVTDLNHIKKEKRRKKGLCGPHEDAENRLENMDIETDEVPIRKKKKIKPKYEEENKNSEPALKDFLKSNEPKMENISKKRKKKFEKKFKDVDADFEAALSLACTF